LWLRRGATGAPRTDPGATLHRREHASGSAMRPGDGTCTCRGRDNRRGAHTRRRGTPRAGRRNRQQRAKSTPTRSSTSPPSPEQRCTALARGTSRLWADQRTRRPPLGGPPGRTVARPSGPMPLPAELRHGLDSDVADLVNQRPGNTVGGIWFAGHFLKEFVGTTARVRIAARFRGPISTSRGSANNSGGCVRHARKGPTGATVRTAARPVGSIFNARSRVFVGKGIPAETACRTPPLRGARRCYRTREMPVVEPEL